MRYILHKMNDLLGGIITALLELWPCDLFMYGYLSGTLIILILIAFSLAAPIYILYTLF